VAYRRPYGGSSALVRSISRYSKRLFIAGGVGITGIAATLCRLRETEHVRLLWWVRSEEELEILKLCLLPDCRRQGQKRLQAHIYISNRNNPLAAVSPVPVGSEVADDGTISDNHYAVLPLVSVRAQVTYRGNSWNSWMVPLRTLQLMCITCSIVGMILSPMIGRWMCCNHIVVDIGGMRLHQCTTSLLFSYLSGAVSSISSESCQSCNNADNTIDDLGPPCCLSPVCYYCFRGAPLLAGFVLIPVWGFVIPRYIERWWTKRVLSHCCRYGPPQYRLQTSPAPAMIEEFLEMEEQEPADMRQEVYDSDEYQVQDEEDLEIFPQDGPFR
jgi:Ferric reductase NAD binding domain